MVSAYELSKLENIKRNKALLVDLGLDKPLLEPLEKVVQKAPPQKKRKAPEPSEIDEKPPAKKQQRTDFVPEKGLRRSSRNAGKVVDYKGEIIKEAPIPVAYSSGVKTTENEGPMGREDGPRLHDPKKYGHIPGIEVGTWWETRMGCSKDAVHAPPVGGISGGPQGAYSIALSGGYEDDVDLGYAFTYTGSGTSSVQLRTAPQSSDQTFENNFNRMLLRSTQNKKPVRVIRGYKLKSKYAPSEGYRYDGLYTVEKAWMEKGLNPKGYLVCKFAFKRVPEQPPLQIRAGFSPDDENEGNCDGTPNDTQLKDEDSANDMDEGESDPENLDNVDAESN
ncbi:hypothetical protein CVT26_002142 [Gymnopilus dilepis]|uniref:YDG domain-containing protein n=1 Tax=Gymnopilus dilepis TaxID=231916 RepID=A0A409VDW0_9AGAR|nr:hypothetical protein CVT26_002142 [Gymnopilus dilepis]